MIRLYVDHVLAEGEAAPLSRDQAHYLSGVMRRSPGDRVLVFDGRSGEFEAQIEAANKRGGVLRVLAQTKPLQVPPDLWLCFAPIKKARTDFIVEKAAELGASRIVPVQTAFTNADRVRQDRLQAHAVEAAEQCGGTYVPEVAELSRLRVLLDTWPQARRLMFCDEALAGGAETACNPSPNRPLFFGESANIALPKEGITEKCEPGAALGPWAILIGPEGGFSPQERERLHAMPQAHPVRLGPRILRADTAAVAALTLWQAAMGDWR